MAVNDVSRHSKAECGNVMNAIDLFLNHPVAVQLIDLSDFRLFVWTRFRIDPPVYVIVKIDVIES